MFSSNSVPLIRLHLKIPEQRFKVSDYEDPKYAKPGRAMKACTGNFIDGVDEFDHTFFRISPREAKSMDPQQRVLLQTAYEALENSGYVPNDTPSFQQQTFGCYIGAATHDYLQNLRDNIDVYYSTGKTFVSFATFEANVCGSRYIESVPQWADIVSMFHVCLISNPHYSL